jgi:S-DNA-T family DNA segregation ATPase FtsK/SpoIIIE
MPNDEQLKTITAITLKLAQLGLEVSFVEPITVGPIITTYRFTPRSASKVSQITGCAQDLALTLAVEDVLVRRLAGEAVIGVSVPNKTRTSVNWRDTLGEPDPSMLIPLNLGVDSEGKRYVDDLTKCPHLLIAGTTGSGKSTELHAITASLLYWRSPEQVQLLLSDTKNVEFGHFIGAPHLLYEPATTMYRTWELMDWLIDEMDRRLKIIGRIGCRNIVDYNGFCGISTSHNTPAKLSYIVLIIDELADVLGGDKRGEAKIANAKLGRIVQKSRAAGVHVIAATQRPSVNVVSGSIKANFPARLSFRLPSEADSRTVLSESGAEHLLSQGDMLYNGGSQPTIKRLHASYATIDDIRQCVSVARMQHAMR